jgi:hypothetical protein
MLEGIETCMTFTKKNIFIVNLELKQNNVNNRELKVYALENK